ncbi:MAG: hypothetical protein ABFD90_18725 [Phycisphaerales bacterium]
MTPFRKTSIHLTLFAVLSIAGGDGLAASTAGASAPAAAGVSASTSSRYAGDVFLSSGRRWATEPVLVVPGKEMDAETVNRLIEDLSVMGRIIERNTSNVLESADSDAASLYRRMRFRNGDASPAVLFSSPGRARPLYVAGYGALFFIQVDFPLVPPAETAEKAPAKEDSDTVWVQTRRSILEPEWPGMYPARDTGASPPYSRERIETLKSTLTTTMKHGTNIRGLETGEWLTIVLQGTSPQTEGSPTGGTGGRSTLTVRATKADVDLHAKGELTPAQFEQRLQVVSY